jgi:hypothetical protein
MGHRDFKTTLVYAHYAPSDQEAELIERAFASIKKPSNRAQVSAADFSILGLVRPTEWSHDGIAETCVDPEDTER